MFSHCKWQGGRHDTVVVFLHGFLGSSEDWLPIMHALALSSECVSIDLPGHGKTRINDEGMGKPFYYETIQALDPLSMENVAQALSLLLRCMSKKKVILVGYSMGARIALHMAVKFNSQVITNFHATTSLMRWNALLT
jgi:isochorismate synthase/2-succinyl-5-enolpyruvyl-6-hydroxy-3-cyclohexene-1-carboxylate synthase/2-succinyl-6-hydroxy-2,4-cyclohexadiene-1-carboxylate synthase/O-succinylbenzoate synthase